MTFDICSGLIFDSENEICEKYTREYKGKSVLDLVRNYICIDIETTGLDPQYDSIIEIAAIRAHEGTVTETFSSLVNPGFSIDPFIINFTGITNEMLSLSPGISEVIPRFREFIGSSMLIAHNANFDINFLYDNSIRCSLSPLNNDFIDTMRMSRNIFKEEHHHRLKDLILRFGITPGNEHRALSDATNTMLCYEYMYNYVLKNGIKLSTKRIKNNYSLHHIKPESGNIVSNTFIHGKTFVFTGALERMTRTMAAQLVVNAGGLCSDSVTKKVNYLVLGNGSYKIMLKDGKSSKHKKAEQLKLKGYDIEIISENVFFDMLMESSLD